MAARAKPKPMRLDAKQMFALVAYISGEPMLVGDGVEFPLYEWERDARGAIRGTPWRVIPVEIREITPPPKPKRSGQERRR